MIHPWLFRARRGATLLEALLAIGITAGAVVLATTFAVNGLAISTDLNAQQDFNGAMRRTEREFAKDVPAATRFFFGFFDTSTGSLTTLINPTAQEVTFGYVNQDGNDIWVHYGARTSVSTGKIYLVKSTNELTGDDIYLTTVLASDLEGLSFTFRDALGDETQLVNQIKRIDMDVTLASAEVKRTMTFTAVLRGTNQGAVRPPAGLDFAAIEEANFTK